MVRLIPGKCSLEYQLMLLLLFILNYVQMQNCCNMEYGLFIFFCQYQTLYLAVSSEYTLAVCIFT